MNKNSVVLYKNSVAVVNEIEADKYIIKYCSRYGLKDDEVKEASKILDYALWLLLEAKGVEIDPNKHNHSEILKHFGIN